MDEIYKKFLGDVDLKALQKQWTGGEFRALVAFKMELGGPGLAEAVKAAADAFDAGENAVASEVTREFQELANDQTFWSRDAGQVLAQITSRFEEKMNERGRETKDLAKFNMFQSLLCGFAWSAVVNVEFRRFIGA